MVQIFFAIPGRISLRAARLRSSRKTPAWREPGIALDEVPAGLPGQRLLFGDAGKLPIHVELVGPLEQTYQIIAPKKNLATQAAAKEHPGQDQYDQQARDADATAAGDYGQQDDEE